MSTSGDITQEANCQGRSKGSRQAEESPARKKPAAPEENGDGAPAPAGEFDLVIVESPTKAKTINKYLGPGYRVLASYGHVRDLATRKKKGEDVAGIDIDNGWKLRYVVDDGSEDDGPRGRGKRKTPAADPRRDRAARRSKANRVLLATDPDREGESIAWHIADELGLPEDRTFRIRFNEITKTAVQAALDNPEKIDMRPRRGPGSPPGDGPRRRLPALEPARQEGGGPARAPAACSRSRSS